MPWNETLYPWVIHSAIVSLLVLATGSVAVLLCRRPARRVWMIELILAGCLIAPWLGVIPGYPRLRFGWRVATSLHQEEAALPDSADSAGRMVGPSVVPPSNDLPVFPHTVTPEAQPRTEEAPSHAFDLASWIVAVYMVGVALGLGWWLVGLLGLVQIVRMTRPAPSRCRELLAQIGGHRASKVKLLASRRVRQPFAFALGRPVIVLPEDLCGDDQALRWSLAHEWTHIERHDFRAWLTAGLARVLFFYHPLIWWLRQQLRLSQDFLADDRAARQTPQPEDYAEFLTASAAAGSLRPALAGLGMGSCKSELYRRVVMLVQNRPMESRVPRLWTLSMSVAVLFLVVAVAAVSIVPLPAAEDRSVGPPQPVATESQEPAHAESVRKPATGMTKPRSYFMIPASAARADMHVRNGAHFYMQIDGSAVARDGKLDAATNTWTAIHDELQKMVRESGRFRTLHTQFFFSRGTDLSVEPALAAHFKRLVADLELYVVCVDIMARNDEVKWDGHLTRALGLRAEPGKESSLSQRPDTLPQSPASKQEADAKTVRGKVIDESGKPVAGAEIWLRLVMRGAGHVQTSHAQSDAQGQFALEVAPDWLVTSRPWDRGAMTVWAYAPGRQFGTGRVMLPGGASDVAIQLGPATDTLFVVLDPEGQSCVGALVEPYYIRTTLGFQPLPEGLMARVAARTDAEGRVKLPAASRDVLSEVRITTKEFGIQVQRTEKSEPPAVVGGTIHLRHVGKIEGRVIASEPEIARGVRLIFTSEEYSGKSPPWLTEGHADVKSDENGRFIVPTMAAGVLRIDIFVNETQPLRPQLPDFVRLRAGKTTSLEIPMVRTVTVRGSVRAKDTGKPIPGALVHIYYGVGRQGADPVTDAQGNYTARVLPGRVGLQMTSMPQEYVQLGEPWNRPIEVPYVETFDLPPVEVVPAKSIEGRLIDERDQPVSNAGVCVIEGNRRYGYGTSDSKGHFSVAGVPVTIDPAKVKFHWFKPDTGMPRECEIVKASPLVLRALPRAPRMDEP